jgi:K+/H+ antiporter YhaU regulatory subunit KhtT
MPVELRETRLPGIGVKYAIRTTEGGRHAIVLHMTLIHIRRSRR